MSQSRSAPVTAVLLAATALLVGACASALPSSPDAARSPAASTGPSKPEVTPSPSRPATPTAAATASNTELEGVIVTIRVAGSEEYRIQLTDPADIAVARALLAGEEAPTIPNGRILPGDGGVNTGYSWHIDPDSLEWADFTIEVCDGLPSHVEDGTLSGTRYCPWSAEVVAIEPAS